MQWFKHTLVALIFISFFAACDSDVKKHPDNLSTGSIDISVDETFQPIIEQELKVFLNSYKDAKITAHYKPESECFKDFLENKARLILVTRNLMPGEKQMCEQRQIVPTAVALAKDAIAVILNPASTDTLLNINEIRGILTGAYKNKYTVVVDNQGSSTVRYITDSLLPGTQLGANVYAAKGNEAVVDYVAKNPNAIGFIGMSYVTNLSDSTTESFLNKVRVASIQNDSTRQFYKPYQAYIALKLYPFTRKLFYIHRETYMGLGTGFANFMSTDRGQLIFGHTHMFPLRMNIVIRDAAVNP
ncbi:MAG: substrate-binding domain-containing protein [Bacteroidota bacterium]